MGPIPSRRWNLRLASIVAIAAAVAVPRDAAAQVVNFRHYTGIEGLPQSQVMAIHQDGQGYLWFATYGGLTRFNGREFRTFTREDGLASNAVFDVTADEAGRLLIATSRGACIMDQDRFQCRGQRDGLVNDNTRSVRPDGAGGLWVASAAGVAHVARGGAIRNYGIADGLPAGRMGRVVVDAQARVWVGTEKGLARLVGERFVVDSTTASGNAAVNFVARAGAALLFGSGNRLFIRQGDSTALVPTGTLPDSTRFTDGTVSDDGTIWVSMRTGVLRIRGNDVQRLDESNGLLSSLVIRVAIDREGNVWFGTERGASEHIPGPFRTYTRSEGLPSPFVRAVTSDAAGVVWIGTRNGIAVRDGERFRSIALPGIPDNRVYALAKDPGGALLIGTARGLVVYKAGQIQVMHEQEGLPSEVVYSLVADSAGVWVGTDRGLARWSGGRLTRSSPHGLPSVSIMSMALDRRGRLWLGRQSGGIMVVEGDSVRSITSAKGGTDETVWTMREDAGGRMWAGTNGDGALRIDDTSIKRFTMADGLASNFIWQVLSDAHSDIWLFGNLGLDRLAGDRVRHYGRGAGLIELEGSANAAFEDREGNLWFGTGSGLVRFNPGLDAVPVVAPPVYIEEGTATGVPFRLTSQSGVRLDRGVVRVRFASPSFRDQSALRYRYRLIGTNDPWSSPTSETSITYAGLAPGDYRLEVLASNGELESAKPAMIAFTVLPALWQTWWFRAIAILLLAAAAAAAPVLRARGLERERRRLEGLVAQHTRELAQQNARLGQSNRDLEQFAYVASHDLQEPLRKIQAFSDRVVRGYAAQLDDQGRDYLGRMGAAAARMQQLIDDLLSLSRVTTKRNAMEPISLGSLVADVQTDLEFRIQSTSGRVEVGALPSVVGDPVQLRQLFQNLIGNALKFHQLDVNPIVRVTGMTRDDDSVEIRISDNGIGFDTKDAERVFLPFHRLHGRGHFEGTGIGLTICQKIIDRHGGTIRADSQPGLGTTFVFTLPPLTPTGVLHAA